MRIASVSPDLPLKVKLLSLAAFLSLFIGDGNQYR
jgi:hypothetical protein